MNVVNKINKMCSLKQLRNFHHMAMDDEKDLLQDWFTHLIKSKYEYREPLFGEIINSFIKKTCDALKQDAHVFALAVEILEKFVHAKIAMHSIIENEVLTACVCVLIASKFTGDAIELKIKHVEAYIKKLTGCEDKPNIKQIELHILSTIDGKVPLTTRMDDMVTVIEKFSRDSHLNATLLPFCTEILSLIYVVWKDFFFDLKMLYNQNIQALSVFKLLITNKLYLPVGILIAALKISNYKYILNIENIVCEYSKVSKIHQDHLNTLAGKIILVIRALNL